MITLKMDVGGVTHDLRVLANNLKSLRAPLKEISKAKREEVQARFNSGGPGWTPLQEASAKVHAKAVIQRESFRQIKAVTELSNRVRGQFKAAARRSSVKASTLAKRRMELEVINQLTAPWRASSSPIDAGLRDKVMARLFSRAVKIQSGVDASSGILGKIARSIFADIDDRKLVLASKILWSGVHNDGGTAGKGAKIPARPFLEWTERDLTLAVEAFERHMLKGING